MKPPVAPNSELSKGFEYLAWVGAVFFQCFPAASYFLDFAPPFFPPLGVFVSFVGMAFLFWGYYREKRRGYLLKRAIRFIVIAVLFVVVYGVALQYLSVVPPGGREGPRRQTGFYMFDWSLTVTARQKVKELSKGDPPIAVHTPNDLMNVFGVWGDMGRTDEIWHLWSIITAGMLLVFLFLAACAFWAYGLGVLMRFLVKQSRTANKK